MSKNQKETKKFPKMKVILNVVLACSSGFESTRFSSRLDAAK